MTARGRLVLCLGLAVYGIAWAFGSRPLYPIGVGLVLAVGLAWLLVRLAAQPMRLRRDVGAREPLEGDDVTVELDLRLDGRLLPASVTVVEHSERLGERRTELGRDGRRLWARYALERVPRGRYAFGDAEALVEDAFGLERARVPLAGEGALLVYPRLVELGRLFSESGVHAHDGRRLLLRRPSGFELHSVREYEQGESLRKVHWPSTARRGQLMVKELEDSPRDEVAVLLDGEAAAVVGAAPDSSFELQVRAAGSILSAHARRGRRAVLVVNSARRETQAVHAVETDWRRALDLLAAVEPTAGEGCAAFLADGAGPAGRALELVVVTARLAPTLVERLVQRAGGRRGVSLVYVEAASFAGAAPARQPALLRLQAAGIPVAVLRRADDLAARLGEGVPASATAG